MKYFRAKNFTNFYITSSSYLLVTTATDCLQRRPVPVPGMKWVMWPNCVEWDVDLYTVHTAANPDYNLKSSSSSYYYRYVKCVETAHSPDASLEVKGIGAREGRYNITAWALDTTGGRRWYRLITEGKSPQFLLLLHLLGTDSFL